MKHWVMGTAGHVDHGKTLLVKTLTGIDTDRLKEEKERGITIELGFASLPLNNGEVLSIVDVPGHEKFVKNMVAGASGMDFVLFVIAADEGVMPQTREHMSICGLLGVTNGIIALTKADTIEEEWLSLMREDIRKFVDESFLKDTPIIPVSSVSGFGMPELLLAINDMATTAQSRRHGADIFRLPIDRTFTIKGFGTVVTGTVISGSISIGEDVELLPDKIKTKVRTIQSHGQMSTDALTGQRAAINLLNVDKAMIERGAMLTPINTIPLSRRFDVQLSCDGVGVRKIKNRDIVRFHSATSEILARVVLLDRDDMVAGEQCFAQLYLTTPFPAIAGDKFVIRSYSPVTTIGGGVIIDPLARKQKRFISDSIATLQKLATGGLPVRLEIILERAGYKGALVNELVVRTGENRKRVLSAISKLVDDKKVIVVDEEAMVCISVTALEKIQATISKRLAEYHKRNPLKKGVTKEELRVLTGAFLPVKVFALALKRQENSGELANEANEIYLSSHRVSLKDDMSELKTKVVDIYRSACLSPPTLKELTGQFASPTSDADFVGTRSSRPVTAKDLKSAITMLLAEKVLLKVNEEMLFDSTAIEKLRHDYTNILMQKERATPADFKELTGLPRKFIIPLMEYFDAAKITIRVGDARVLRERKQTG